MGPGPRQSGGNKRGLLINIFEKKLNSVQEARGRTREIVEVIVHQTRKPETNGSGGQGAGRGSGKAGYWSRSI